MIYHIYLQENVYRYLPFSVKKSFVYVIMLIFIFVSKKHIAATHHCVSMLIK